MMIGTPTKLSPVLVALAILLVFAIAFWSRIGLIDHPPIYDELYQFLPAISWHENRSFAVLDGVYDRSALFTQLIAASLGDGPPYSLVDARLIPSVIPGALLVALVFGWALRHCGPVVATVTAAMLIFWPNGIEVSQYIRFYAAQGLLFVAAVLLIFTAVTAQISHGLRAVCVLVALILIFLAAKLQVLTILTLTGVGLWILVFHAPKWLRAEPRLWWLVGVGVLGVAGVLISGVANDTIVWAWTTYHWEPWPVLNDTTFYHRNFRDNYPTVWPLFPLIALVAIRANYQVGTFCTVLFGTAFVLQSFGGLKSVRYLYSSMPFFFVLCGLAMNALLPAIWTALKTAGAALLPDQTPERLRTVLVTGMILIGLGFLAFANAAVPRSLKLILGDDENQLLGKPRWEWTQASKMMAPWLEKRALIVTTEEMSAVQHLGDYDLGFNKPRFSELLYSVGADTQPFHPDFRSGRPLIGELADFKEVMLCHPVGVLMSNAPNIQGGQTLSLIEFGEANAIDLSFERDADMSILGWEHQVGKPLPTTCEALYDFGSDRAADRINSGRAAPQPIGSAFAER